MILHVVPENIAITVRSAPGIGVWWNKYEPVPTRSGFYVISGETKYLYCRADNGRLLVAINLNFDMFKSPSEWINLSDQPHNEFHKNPLSGEKTLWRYMHPIEYLFL